MPSAPPLPAEPPYDDVDQPLAAPPRRRRPGCGCLLPTALALLVVLVGALAAALLLTPPRETVLVLGSDARPDEIRRGDVGRTDSLLLVVADRATPRAALVSIPRDLWVAIPGNGEERINAAYAIGGAAAAKGAAGSVLGLRVDRYLVIGLQGVRDVVDAVGGVEITVPQTIQDDAYPTDDYGTISITIPAGRQRMDGETALRYARTRHQDSDFGRTARQQQVMAAVRTQLLRPDNWGRIPAVLAVLQRSVKTDVGPLDAVAIGAALLRAGELDRLVLDTEYVEPFTGLGGAFLLQPKPDLQRRLAQFLGSPVPVNASVEVLNASGAAGAARATADRLQRAGFEVARVGDAERQQAASTVVVRPELRRSGDAIATTLGLPASRVLEGGLPPGVDVRVLIGPDLAR